MRILLAEDDAMLADGLIRALTGGGHIVDRTDSGRQADQALQNTGYDLVILDLSLIEMDGYEVLRLLRSRDRATPVMILTARDAVEDRVRGLDLGADDYMIKPIELSELEARVRAVTRRNAAQRSSRIEHGPLALDTVARRAWIEQTPLELTQREWGLLEFLLRRSGRVVSKEQILEALCGWDKEITLNAVEVYVSRLRSKLEPAGIAIRTVRGFGYLLMEPDRAA